MPLLETRGAASAAGFGFGASKGGAVAPFIARLTTKVRTANLFDDGSVLVMADGSSNLDFGILAAGTHTNSATKTAGSSYYGNGDHFDTAKTNATTGVLGYIQGFAAVTNTNTVSLARSSTNTGGFGGAPPVSTAVDSAGNIYLASSLYANSGSVNTLPCIRKHDSSGALQWSKIYTSEPSVSTAGYANVTGIAVGGTYVYVTIVDYQLGLPVLLCLSKADGSVVHSSTFQEAIYATSSVSAPAINAAGNVFVAAYNNIEGGTNLYKLSEDTNTLVTFNRVTGIGTPVPGSGVAFDSVTGNVFWLFTLGYNDAGVLKTTSSFTSPSAISVADNTSSFTYSSNFQVTANHMCFVNSDAKLIFVLPLDGTKTGTYSVGGASVTYSSVATPTITSGTPGITYQSYNVFSETMTSNNISIFTGTPFTVSSVNL